MLSRSLRVSRAYRDGTIAKYPRFGHVDRIGEPHADRMAGRGDDELIAYVCHASCPDASLVGNAFDLCEQRNDPRDDGQKGESCASDGQRAAESPTDQPRDRGSDHDVHERRNSQPGGPVDTDDQHPERRERLQPNEEGGQSGFHPSP